MELPVVLFELHTGFLWRSFVLAATKKHWSFFLGFQTKEQFSSLCAGNVKVVGHDCQTDVVSIFHLREGILASPCIFREKKMNAMEIESLKRHKF